MFKSKPVLGLIITTLSSNFGISLLTTFSPTYMSEILKFDIRTVIFCFLYREINYFSLIYILKEWRVVVDTVLNLLAISHFISSIKR
jgi:hypothetical protein